MATTSEERKIKIVADAQQAGATIKQLEQGTKALWSQLRNLTPGTDEFIKKSKEFDEVKGRLTSLKDEVNGVKKGFFDLGGASNLVKTALGGAFAVTGIVELAGQLIDFGRKAYELAKTYSDSFADIRKSTGMTADEVQALNDRIGDLDTRTSQLDLLEIAKVGGQIGIATNQMDGFIESTDKAVVALGDEFSGGAEEVAGKMGTLASLFKQTKDLNAGDAINQIGSALNELGATGSATAPVVADFTARIGQLGNLAPEISQTMGLGAAFQELGLSAEISAGGLTNILLTASKSTDTFAQHLGMTNEKFKEMINTDPNEVVLKLAESFKGVPADQLAKRLAALGINSQEATKVMSLLSNQTDKVREKQQLANKAMQEGTSLTNEFNVKNNTDAAIAEKRAKAWEKLQLQFGQGIAPAISLVQELLIGLFGVLEDVFSTLEPYFTDFFNVLGELARSLGITADKGSFLAGVFEAIKIILNISLIPLKAVLSVITALVGGFNYAYQSSSLFRGAIDSMLVPVKALWEGIKQVISWISKLSEMAGKEIKVKTSVETDKKNTNNNTNQNNTTAIQTTTLNTLDSEAEADKKAAEKEAKKQEQAKKNAEKKQKDEEDHQKKMQKLRDDYDQKSLKADQDLEALREAISEKGTDARLLKMITSHNKQMAEIERNKEAVLKNEAITEQQKIDLINKYNAEKDILQRKFDEDKAAYQEEQRQKQLEAENERLAAQDEEELARLEAQDEADQLRIEGKLQEAIDAEMQKQDAIYEIKKAAAERELAFLQQSDTATAAQIQAAQNKLLALEVEHGKQKVENAKKTEELKRVALQQGLGFASDALDIGIQLLSKDEEARKKNAGVIKAFSVGKIITDLATEISGYMAHPGSIASLGVVGTIKAVLATVRAGLAVRNVLAQKFADGGNTMSSLVMGQLYKQNSIPMVEVDGVWQRANNVGTFAKGGHIPNTSLGVIGEKGAEWVAPNWMLKSPKYANIIGYLEAARARRFETGSFTNPGVSLNTALADNSAATSQMQVQEKMLAEMSSIKERLMAYQMEVSKWQREIYVSNNIVETRKALTLLNQIESDSTIS
ncbi:phage tail tape measure protein [Xanthocytophaga agilis]|uniref:Phage tail tape measure protein n=1 Tax=Xanthocytophaga agilis TaxID=3048010 RepID=A0AAE3UFD2_9BACT|nr:phage tail tape measure protein [Xanthocytophaga agilis]MDJ1500448.1 phage tail tape measure protein [Xanthocytophaga agilis]